MSEIQVLCYCKRQELPEAARLTLRQSSDSVVPAVILFPQSRILQKAGIARGGTPHTADVVYPVNA